MQPPACLIGGGGGGGGWTACDGKWSIYIRYIYCIPSHKLPETEKICPLLSCFVLSCLASGGWQLYLPYRARSGVHVYGMSINRHIICTYACMHHLKIRMRNMQLFVAAMICLVMYIASAGIDMSHLHLTSAQCSPIHPTNSPTSRRKPRRMDTCDLPVGAHEPLGNGEKLFAVWEMYNTEGKSPIVSRPASFCLDKVIKRKKTQERER